MAVNSSDFRWQSLRSMPTKRVFSTAVDGGGAGGQLYVIGGCDARGQPLDAFESYDRTRDKWSRLLNVPTGRAAPCAAVVGDRWIVTMGGISAAQQPLDVVEVYDTVEKKWTQRDPMRDKLLGLSSVVRGESINSAGSFTFNFCSATS